MIFLIFWVLFRSGGSDLYVRAFNLHDCRSVVIGRVNDRGRSGFTSDQAKQRKGEERTNCKQHLFHHFLAPHFSDLSLSRTVSLMAPFLIASYN